MTAATASPARLRRRAFALEYASMAWMVAEAGAAHRLADPQPLAGRAEGAPGVLAALVGVHGDPGTCP